MLVVINLWEVSAFKHLISSVQISTQIQTYINIQSLFCWHCSIGHDQCCVSLAISLYWCHRGDHRCCESVHCCPVSSFFACCVVQETIYVDRIYHYVYKEFVLLLGCSANSLLIFIADTCWVLSHASLAGLFCPRNVLYWEDCLQSLPCVYFVVVCVLLSINMLWPVLF